MISFDKKQIIFITCSLLTTRAITTSGYQPYTDIEHVGLQLITGVPTDTQVPDAEADTQDNEEPRLIKNCLAEYNPRTIFDNIPYEVKRDLQSSLEVLIDAAISCENEYLQLDTALNSARFSEACLSLRTIGWYVGSENIPPHEDLLKVSAMLANSCNSLSLFKKCCLEIFEQYELLKESPSFIGFLNTYENLALHQSICEIYKLVKQVSIHQNVFYKEPVNEIVLYKYLKSISEKVAILLDYIHKASQQPRPPFIDEEVNIIIED